MLVLVLAVLPISLTTLTFAQNPSVTVGLPVSGFVGATQTQEWQFISPTTQNLNVIVQRTSGDLDPVVSIYDPNGAIIAQNDDHIAGAVFDASVGSVTFEQNTPYGIRIGSYWGSGDYRLWVVPGYPNVWESESFEGNASRWAGPYAKHQGDTLLLSTEGLIGRQLTITPRGQVAVSDFYLQADFAWVSGDSNARVGLLFRATSSGDGYYLSISPNGTWSLARQQAGATETLQPPIRDDQLPAERFTLGVWAEGNLLRLYLNGVLLGEIPVVESGTGLWGFHILGSQLAALAQVDNVLLTVPTISPPPTYPTTLQNWRSSRPEDITAELAEQGLIGAQGRRSLLVPSTSYQVSGQQNRFYVQDNSENTNYAASVDVSFPAGADIACGLALRYINDSNQVIAYADSSGGAALLDVDNGIPSFNAYDLVQSPLEPLSDGSIRLTAIVNQEWVALYVNGDFFASTFTPPSIGQVGVTLLNYGTSVGSCAYSNLWVWAFDSP